MMGLLPSSYQRADYDNAAKAVANGTATKEQQDMNDRAAKQMGSMGSNARAAQEAAKRRGW